MKTNLQTYGPFSTDYCSESVEIIQIPSGTRLIDFFKSNIKTALVRTEIEGNQYFFDGFTSDRDGGKSFGHNKGRNRTRISIIVKLAKTGYF